MESAEIVYLDSEEKYLNISIERTKDNNISDQAKKLLKDYYQLEDEVSPQQAYARAAVAYCYGDYELAQRIYNYASDGWFMYASPVLSNAPLPNEKTRALPISCFLFDISATLSILAAWAAMFLVLVSNAVNVSPRSKEHTSELQSPCKLVCRLLIEKKKKKNIYNSSKKRISIPGLTRTLQN